MSDFPSLPPPSFSQSQSVVTVLDCEVLQASERKYESWVADLHRSPHPTPVGVRQLDVDEMTMDLEEEESILDSEEGSLGNDMIVFGGDDSDPMEDSSVQDNSAFNDSS